MIRHIRNFIEDFILEYKNKIFSSKYILKGKCKRCGKCCRNILFSNEKGFVKSEEDFLKMQKKYRYYRNFSISGKIESDKDFENGALTFKCKHITDKNRCNIYFFRPYFCRIYPAVDKDLIYNGVEMLEGCGFHFEVNKNFKSYLK